ncbi:segregation and condensation protein A [Enterococcus saigonensis]|uniref:Segregation and condensation protein A n=1 Tax=Enterococcus saigonensis TaxID=1805431 RepID=A0A679IJR4_9ENTE|nr:segregation/condensation protein A [Enterococcus saigonensis]BCA85486.1 segregation and condensation protein A [Enterococcus saigonensis]
MSEINVKLDVFEGPLDLLLHLIQKLEIDIYDIPIATITEQYMQYIHAMQTLELEVAGDYLVVAATLMAIKSKMLLPKQEFVVAEDVYEEDPREVLVSQLLEYRKFKYAAEVLSDKAKERRDYFTKEPMDVDDYKENNPLLPANQLNTIDLFLAFHNMLKKKKKRQIVETTIASDETTIEDKMSSIKLGLATLKSHEGKNLTDFLQNYTKSEVVTTFLAVLELIKTGSVIITQSENYGEIILYATGDSNEN